MNRLLGVVGLNMLRRKSGVGLPFVIASLIVAANFASPSLYAARVVVAKSSNIPAYDKVVKSIEDHAPFEVFSLSFSENKKTNDKVLKQIWEAHPDLIIALGSRALSLVKDNFRSTPIIFGLVTNPTQVSRGDKPTPGVLLLPSPEQMIGSIRMLMPEARRVAVIFDALAEDLNLDCPWQARYGNIEIVRVGLREESEWDNTISGLRGKVDVAVVDLSGRLVSRDFIAPLLKKTIGARIPIVTYSGSLVEMGALLAIEPNLESVGRHLARMASLVIEEGKLEEMGIRPPPNTQLIVNLSIANLFGIAIPQAVEETALIVGK